VENALKLLPGALQTAKQCGRTRLRFQRAQVNVAFAKTLKETLVGYMNCRLIENKPIELETKHAKWVRGKGQGFSGLIPA